MNKKFDEAAGDQVPCPVCEKLLKNTPRSVGAHIGYWHKEEAKNLYQQSVEFTIRCLECNELVGNSLNVLGRHIRKIHQIEWPDYLVKHEHGGEWPLCKCGCGKRVKWKKGGFRKFLKGHDAKGENNPMYGKRGKDNPNFGKVRTEEHKENYRNAAKIRDNTKRFASMRTPEYREAMREHAIRRSALGLIGPQSYKTEWKYNPFTDQEEYMHSSWESKFLDKMIEENIPVTKVHDIRIKYTDPNDIERVYVPDFFALDESIIYEIKGGYDPLTEIKRQATQEQLPPDCEYVVLGYDKQSDEFFEK